jgi:hypothetical protein
MDGCPFDLAIRDDRKNDWLSTGALRRRINCRRSSLA